MGQNTELRHKSGISLYYQLFSYLRDSIVAGQMPYGSFIPSEQALAERFAVSRVTARRAVQQLVELGLVERRPRRGTRVIIQDHTTNRGSDSDQPISMSEETVRLIRYEVVEPLDDVVSLLELKAGTRVVHAIRLRVFKGKPFALIDSVVPENFAAHVVPENLIRSHLYLLLRKAGHDNLKYDQIISSVAANPLSASNLEVEERSSLLCVKRIMKTPDDVPVALSTTFFPADRVQLEIGGSGLPEGIQPRLLDEHT